MKTQVRRFVTQTDRAADADYVLSATRTYERRGDDGVWHRHNAGEWAPAHPRVAREINQVLADRDALTAFWAEHEPGLRVVRP